MSKEKTKPEEEKSLPEILEDEAIQPPIGQYELSDFVAAMRETRPEELPLIELRNNVLFPRTLTPITVGRERTKKLMI